MYFTNTFTYTKIQNMASQTSNNQRSGNMFRRDRNDRRNGQRGRNNTVQQPKIARTNYQDVPLDKRDVKNIPGTLEWSIDQFNNTIKNKGQNLFSSNEFYSKRPTVKQIQKIYNLTGSRNDYRDDPRNNRRKLFL